MSAITEILIRTEIPRRDVSEAAIRRAVEDQHAGGKLSFPIREKRAMLAQHNIVSLHSLLEVLNRPDGEYAVSRSTGIVWKPEQLERKIEEEREILREFNQLTEE